MTGDLQLFRQPLAVHHNRDPRDLHPIVVVARCCSSEISQQHLVKCKIQYSITVLEHATFVDTSISNVSVSLCKEFHKLF